MTLNVIDDVDRLSILKIHLNSSAIKIYNFVSLINNMLDSSVLKIPQMISTE